MPAGPASQGLLFQLAAGLYSERSITATNYFASLNFLCCEKLAGTILYGAGDGIRTRDLQLGKLTLYH
jgi:hypothetical protein